VLEIDLGLAHRCDRGTSCGIARALRGGRTDRLRSRAAGLIDARDAVQSRRLGTRLRRNQRVAGGCGVADIVVDDILCDVALFEQCTIAVQGQRRKP
jgi:hypothetical protein